jgi:hypothetical protein
MMLQTCLENFALTLQTVDRARAAQYMEEALSLDFGFVSQRRTWDLLFFSQVQLANRDDAGAASTLTEACVVARQFADGTVFPPILIALARLLRRRGQADDAARALGASAIQRERIQLAGGPADLRARAARVPASGGAGRRSLCRRL